MTFNYRWLNIQYNTHNIDHARISHDFYLILQVIFITQNAICRGDQQYDIVRHNAISYERSSMVTTF